MYPKWFHHGHGWKMQRRLMSSSVDELMTPEGTFCGCLWHTNSPCTCSVAKKNLRRITFDVAFVIASIRRRQVKAKAGPASTIWSEAIIRQDPMVCPEGYNMLRCPNIVLGHTQIAAQGQFGVYRPRTLKPEFKTLKPKACNVGIAIINHPFVDGLYDPFMVIRGMVYDIATPTLTRKPWNLWHVRQQVNDGSWLGHHSTFFECDGGVSCFCWFLSFIEHVVSWNTGTTSYLVFIHFNRMFRILCPFGGTPMTMETPLYIMIHSPSTSLVQQSSHSRFCDAKADVQSAAIVVALEAGAATT